MPVLSLNSCSRVHAHVDNIEQHSEVYQYLVGEMLGSIHETFYMLSSLAY